ncbi:MAG: CDP-alcohol phosphatidyltransferase family protein [Anaerolineae bacterium]
MLTEWARKWSRNIITPIALGLGRVGLTPDMLTVIGFFFNVVVAIILAQGESWWLLGAVLLILSMGFDALDGTLARTTGKVSVFGGFLDSTLDRFSEAVIYLALLYTYLTTTPPHTLEPILIYLTIVGSLMVSYTRARAEGLGLQLKEGLFTRLERIIVLVLGLALTSFFGNSAMLVVLLLLAIGTNVTAVQRLFIVRGKLAQGDLSGKK